MVQTSLLMSLSLEHLMINQMVYWVKQETIMTSPVQVSNIPQTSCVSSVFILCGESDRCEIAASNALHICFDEVVCNDYSATGTRVFVFAPAQHWWHAMFELFSPHWHVNLRSRSHTDNVGVICRRRRSWASERRELLMKAVLVKPKSDFYFSASWFYLTLLYTLNWSDLLRMALV